MAKKNGWSFNIEANIEVQQDKLNRASKILEAFYDKYQDKKIQINTSDLVDATKKGVSAIRDLYEDGTRDATSWLNIRPEMKAQLEGILSDAERVFDGIKVLFNDQSYVNGLENILRGFDNQLSIIFADIGGKYDALKEEQNELFTSLRYDTRLSNDYDYNDITERIELLEHLRDVQNEMQYMNPSLTSDDLADGLDSKALNRMIRQHREAYEEMVNYEIWTMQQLEQRRQIVSDVDRWGWSDSYQDAYKEDKSYDAAIEELTEYINDRKSLIEQLEANEHELFRVDGIEKYVSKVRAQIEIYETYLKEMIELKGNDVVMPDDGIGNLTGVVAQLEAIKDAIIEIKNAFKPLTDAFANEDSALSRMVRANVEDLELLSAKVEEAFRNIEELSNKQFNVTNVLSNGNNTQADIEQIRAFRKEARELFKQVEELYTESMTTASKIKGTPGGLDAFLGFTNTMSEFDMTDLAKRIKSRSAASLGVVIDELNEWKRVLLQFNSLRNNVEAGSFNVSKYADTSSRVNIGSKTTDKDEEPIGETTSVDDNAILNQIKDLGTQVQEELAIIRAKIEETFNFATIDPKIESIQNITENIYRQFEELQIKINALDFKLQLPEVVANPKSESDVINGAADAMKNEEKAAEEAVPKKDAFTEANKKAADSAKDTKESAEGAAEGIKAEAKAAEQANHAYDKISTIYDGDGNPLYATQKKSRIGEKSVDTTTERYTHEVDENGFESWKLSTETVVQDYKAYAKLQTEAQKKIQKAQAMLQKFMSQFENKTAGKWADNNPNGNYNVLKGFLTNGIGSVDEIDNVINKMQLLDAEYNNVVKSFRKGTKSMNPFVNAFNSMDEMKEKVKQAQLDFANLKFPTDTLKDAVVNLPKLLAELDKALKPENGIIDITKIAEAYGNLNAAIKAVNSSIKTQRKADANKSAMMGQIKEQEDAAWKEHDAAKREETEKQRQIDLAFSQKAAEEAAEAERILAQSRKEADEFFAAEDEKALNTLYKERGIVITRIIQLSKKLNALKTDKAKSKAQTELDSEKKRLAVLNKEIDEYGELVNASKLQGQNKRLTNAGVDVDITKTENAQKNQEKTYQNAIKAQERLYNLKKQMVGLDPESSKGQETMRKLTEAQNEYNEALSETNRQLLTIGQLQEIEDLEKKQKAELSTKRQEYQSNVSAEQEAKDLEYVLSLYKQYTDAAQSLKKMQSDPTGAAHNAKIAAAIEDVKRAKTALLSIGIDINNIAESELLTEQQKTALLEEQAKHKKKVRDIEDTSHDKTTTKENKQHQNYGKTIFNRESRYFETISAKERELSSDVSLSEGFLATIEKYKSSFKELEALRSKFENNSDAFNNAELKAKFQDTTIEVERLRKEILSTFKEAEKFEQISASGALLGHTEIDETKFHDAKSAMIDFAANVTNGQFKLEGFNAAGTEMYGTLDKGAGVVEKVTVAIRSGTNQLYAYQTGTKQVSNSWQQLGSSLKSGVKQLIGMYFGLHEAIQAVRQGFTYVKEIDLALTELKKVTNETDEAYKNFLKTASSTSSVIGSTVSDFTDATAAFARLGYSIDESTKMAETAIIYKNVADGLDTVEESTDSIISTMMAYGIAADDTISIIDRFNAVGKLYCPNYIVICG